MNKEQSAHHDSRHQGGGMGILAILIALVFIVGPFAAPFEIGRGAQMMLVGFGVVLLLVGSGIVVITRLYRRTSADEAFVRTGMGGRKAVIDGGGIVIPVVHQLIWVSLGTMKIKVEKTNREALLTLDKLRADIKAEFYIRVDRQVEGVLQASSTLGVRCSDPEAVKTLLEEKLVSALRTVAARLTLEDLNKERDKFAEDVQAIVKKDIEHNGYMLETVTISHLDQAPPSALDPENNVFDAEGAKRIAEITSTMRVERNKLVVAADKTVKQQDVDKAKFLFEQDVDRETAEADKNRKIAEAVATSGAEAAKVQAIQKQVQETARVESDKAVQLAETRREQEVAVANQEKEQATQLAMVARIQAEEVANRQKEVAIADAEKERALAEKNRLTAERERETEAQAVETVKVKAAADRERERQVIGKQSQADQTKIEDNMKADVAAYSKVKEAEAGKEAAEANAAARLTTATAEKDALVLEAEGQKAHQLIPVQVKNAEVDVDQRKVEVLKQELEAKTANAAIAGELQRALAAINADKEARVAFAQAMGQALAAAKMTIWGDPEALKRVTDSFMSGQATGQFLGGLAAGTPSDVKDLAMASIAGLGKTGAALIKRLTGIDVDPVVVEKAVQEAASDARTPTATGTVGAPSRTK